jgi:hypothetical protein
MKINKAIFVPLYNVQVPQPIEIDFGLPDGIRPLTFHTVGDRTPPYTISDVKFHLTLAPPAVSQENRWDTLKERFPVDGLKPGYDQFHFWKATSCLLVDTVEAYPDTIVGQMLSEVGTSAYEFDLLHSLLSAMKLIDDKEPYFYRAFHAKAGLLDSTETWWPLKDMQGPPLVISSAGFKEILALSNEIWKVIRDNLPETGRLVFDTANGYFNLSSTQSEYNVIFIFLMIAFESMFKRSDEETVSKARSRFGKMIASTKEEYNSISNFMSEDPSRKGCCFLRNGIIHGDPRASVDSNVYWRLKSYIRRALLHIVKALARAEISYDKYYESMEGYTERRFDSLPDR